MTNHKPFYRSKPLILLILLSLFTSLLSLSACGKSEAERCIDKKSHLWNTKANTREENKAYWKAVAQCREKYK